MPLQDCIDRWISSISDGIELRGNPNYLEVKYEDLVTKTEDVLMDVCQFLEIEFELNMMKYYKFDGPSRDVMKFPQNIEATQPIFSSSIGRWKRDLTEEGQSKVMSSIGPHLKDFQYIE
jgi:hypothetical protein